MNTRTVDAGNGLLTNMPLTGSFSCDKSVKNVLPLTSNFFTSSNKHLPMQETPSHLVTVEPFLDAAAAACAVFAAVEHDAVTVSKLAVDAVEVNVTADAV